MSGAELEQTAQKQQRPLSESYDSFDSEYQLVSMDGLLSVDALLADLQNTISPGSNTSGYGSLNGPRSNSDRYGTPQSSSDVAISVLPASYG
ncbi:hypothetical protein B566_EDAN010285 [Ephemera danica]|nr:hypothetical protein B566_EDAN010285 [Ephemera danica]